MKDTLGSHCRRSVLTGLATAAIGGVAGCLRLSRSTTGTQQSQSTSSSGNEALSTSTSQTFEEAWTIPKTGSDVVPFDGQFYVSTWSSKQVYSVAPDGSIEWKTDEIGKYKKQSLTVTDSLVVGCGYGGQVTAFNRTTGEIQWDFTDGRYDAWSATPAVTSDYVIAANNVDTVEQDEDFSVYVLEKDTGKVVKRFDYTDLTSPVSSLTILDDMLLVSTYNFTDLYDLSSLSKVNTQSRGLFGSNHTYEGSLYAATDDNVYCYTFDGTRLSQTWGISLRDNVNNIIITGNAIYANGNAGVFKLTVDGDTEWWAQTDAGVGRATVVEDTIVVMDEYLQLYAIDATNGEVLGKRTLSSEGSRAPIGSLNGVVLTTKDPITAYRLL